MLYLYSRDFPGCTSTSTLVTSPTMASTPPTRMIRVRSFTENLGVQLKSQLFPELFLKYLLGGVVLEGGKVDGEKC